MAGEIDGGGGSPPGGMPPQGPPGGPQGPRRRPTLAPGAQGKPQPGAAGRRPHHPAPSQQPGYRAPSAPARLPDAATIARRAEARGLGREAVGQIQQDGRASAEFAQATQGASAKHVQSPYAPANDLERFATDLGYSTPAIDRPRFGAQPITAGDLAGLRGNSAVLLGQIAAAVPDDQQLHAVIESLTRAGGQLQIGPEFAKELQRVRPLRDNAAAKAKFKAVVEAFNRFNQAQGGADAGAGANGTDANAGDAGAAAARAALPRGIGAPAQAPIGRSALALPPGAGVFASVPAAGKDDAPAGAAAAGPNAAAAASHAAAGQPPAAGGNSYANLSWDAFIAKFKRDTFDALIARLAIRGEQQALVLATAMIMRDLNVKASEAARDNQQFDSMMGLFTSTLSVKRKLRDLSDANLDQGNKMNELQQDLDKYGTLTDDDAHNRVVLHDRIDRTIAEGARLRPQAGESTDVAEQPFRLLAPSELNRLRQSGNEGQRLADRLSQQQDGMVENNRRACGLEFSMRAQEAECRRRKATGIESAARAENRPLTGDEQRRVRELRQAAQEFDDHNNVGTIADVIHGTKGESMAMSAINRHGHVAGTLQESAAMFDRTINEQGVAIHRAGGPDEAENRYRRRNEVESVVDQGLSIGSQLQFNTTSAEDNRMECHRSGAEPYTRRTQALLGARGPGAPGAEPSVFDRQIELERERARLGPSPSPATLQDFQAKERQLLVDAHLEEAKMLHARMSSTVSSFSAASLAFRHDQLRDWFGPQASHADMERWLKVGPTVAELRQAPGLAHKGYSEQELGRLVEAGKLFTEAPRGTSRNDGVQGFTTTTCKAQMTRHFDDRKEAVRGSLAGPAQAQAIERLEQAHAFFEQFSDWHDQPSPRHTNVIDRELRRFEPKERLNKAAYLVSEGFRPDNSNRDNVRHNLNHMVSRTLPPGELANDPDLRVRHKLECFRVQQDFLNPQTTPNHRLRRIEQYNSALMAVNGRSLFDSTNGLLMGHLAEDAGDLENTYAELNQRKREDEDAIMRMFDVLNQSLSAIPGG